MGCNGYVPCQPQQLRPDLLAERMEGAMPCHNYKGEASQLTELGVTLSSFSLRRRRDAGRLLVETQLLNIEPNTFNSSVNSCHGVITFLIVLIKVVWDKHQPSLWSLHLIITNLTPFKLLSRSVHVPSFTAFRHLPLR